MNLAAETLSHLFWGYAVIWLCVFLYLIALRADQRRLRRNIDALDAELKSLRDAVSGEKVRARG